MKKIHYISIEIRSNGENDIFTLDYDLMLETDNNICIKHNERLSILTKEDETVKINSKLDDINIFYKDWDFLKYKAITCNLYSMEDPGKMLEKMKKKISSYIRKEYSWLFDNTIEDRIKSISLPEVNNE